MKNNVVELTFSSGKFIAFHNVHNFEVLEKNGVKTLKIVHGVRNDVVYANQDKLDFFELITIEE